MCLYRNKVLCKYKKEKKSYQQQKGRGMGQYLFIEEVLEKKKKVVRYRYFILRRKVWGEKLFEIIKDLVLYIEECIF